MAKTDIFQKIYTIKNTIMNLDKLKKDRLSEDICKLFEAIDIGISYMNYFEGYLKKNEYGIYNNKDYCLIEKNLFLKIQWTFRIFSNTLSQSEFEQLAKMIINIKGYAAIFIFNNKIQNIQ